VAEEYLRVKNWEKYQRNKTGKITANGQPVRYIKDRTDKDSDPDYAQLTVFERYVLDALRRLRGRFGRNPYADPTWCARATCVLPKDRPHIPHAIRTLTTRGFLVLTNQQIDSPQVLLEEKSRVEKSRVEKKEQGRTADAVLTLAFSRFWEVYPKKTAKPKAEKAFKKLALQNGELERIITAVGEWSKTDQWQEASGKFIPYPATFINQRRWEDQIPQAKNTDEDLSHLE